MTRGFGIAVFSIIVTITGAYADEEQGDLDELLDTEQPAQTHRADSVPPPVAEPEGEARSQPAAPSEPQSGENEASPAAAPVSRARAVEEIVVTAQKKEESLQNVPISITALSGDFLVESGIENIHDLTAYTPNVKVTTNPCCTTMFIRGFGTPFGGTALEPSVVLVQDELSLPKEVFMAEPLYDIERFEVLRGPQGSLFGKNTSAGLFNVTTRKPTTELGGDFLARVGSLGVHRVEAAIGGPLGPVGDVAQFRLAALESRQAGDVRNTKLDIDEPATEQRAGRLQLAMQPLTGLDMLLIGSYASTSSRIFHDQLMHLRDSHLDFLRQFDPEVEDDPHDHQNSVSLREGLDRTSDLLQANFAYGLESFVPVAGAEVVAVVGHGAFDQVQPIDGDWSPANIIHAYPPADFDYEQSSAEIRFSGTVPAPFSFGELDLLFGTLLFESRLLSNTAFVAGDDFDEFLLSSAGFELATGQESPGGVGFQDVSAAAAALGLDPLQNAAVLEGDAIRFFLRQKIESQGLFGNVSWHLTDRWTLSVGGRLSFEKKTAHAVNECLESGFVCAAIGAEEFDENLERTETDFSPKVTLQYSPIDELTLFATRAQGFKSGGFNNFAFTADTIEVDTESTMSWEVGARGRLFDESLAYGATLFNMDVDDLQLQNVNQSAVQVRNVGSARSRGAELDFQWLAPWEPLSADGAAAFTDGEFTRFPNAPAPVSSGMETQDLSGKRMPYVSKIQFNVTPKLRFPLDTSGIPFARGFLPELAVTHALDVIYRSDFFLDNDLDPHTRQDGYTVLNGRIGLSTTDDALSLGLRVDNITDADALELINDSFVFRTGYVVIQEFQRRYSVDLQYVW